MSLRKLCLLALITMTFSAAASAGNTVSSFTISGSPVVAGSTQFATGTITVAREPGTSGLISVTLSWTPANLSYACEPGHQILYGSGCYVFDGENSTTVKFYGTCVAQSTSVNVTAKVEYNPDDPGQTASVTVDPTVLTVSSDSSVFFTGANQTGKGKASVNAARKGGMYVNLSSTPLYVLAHPSLVTIPDGGTEVTFDLKGNSASAPTDATLTATGCSVSASTTVLVVPGGDINMGRCKQCEAGAGEPINLTNGNVWIQHQDYALAGLGGGIEVTRTWNSLWLKISFIESTGMFGNSWRSTYEERLGAYTGGSKKYWRADGSAWIFRYNSLTQTYALVAPPDERASLTFDSGTTQYTIAFLDGSRHIFNNGGYLIAIVDRNGNQTTITLNASNRPSQVTDAAGRWLRFNYASGLVSSIEDSTGIVATYNYDGQARMLKVTYADGSFLQYNHDGFNNWLSSVTDTDGKVLESHTYEWTRKGLTSERAGGAEKVTVSYPSATLTRVTDSKNNITDYNSGPSMAARSSPASLARAASPAAGGATVRSSTTPPAIALLRQTPWAASPTSPTTSGATCSRSPRWLTARPSPGATPTTVSARCSPPPIPSATPRRTPTTPRATCSRPPRPLQTVPRREVPPASSTTRSASSTA